MAANNEDTTRADERVEETAEQAVTQTAADTAATILEQCSADGSVVTVDDMTALLQRSAT